MRSPGGGFVAQSVHGALVSGLRPATRPAMRGTGLAVPGAVNGKTTVAHDPAQCEPIR
jgi:hypothetical protein